MADAFKRKITSDMSLAKEEEEDRAKQAIKINKLIKVTETIPLLVETEQIT